MDKIAYLKQQLEQEEKLLRIKVVEERKIEKENRYNQYKIEWTDNKIIQLIRNGGFYLNYDGHGRELFYIDREYCFGEESWENCLSKIKYGVANENYEIIQDELNFLFKKIQNKINKAIKDI